jgi:hypothetical protein
MEQVKRLSTATKKIKVGRQLAFLLPRRSALPGPTPERAAFHPSLMKKTSRRDHLSEPSRRSRRDCRQNGGSEGRWEFTASGSLFALGATDAARRAAYRTATGELRFLPL